MLTNTERFISIGKSGHSFGLIKARTSIQVQAKTARFRLKTHYTTERNHVKGRMGVFQNGGKQ